ncbi:alkaline phosphatase family protein [Halosimplex salinum]|uniref:alkaline phosphatase family protein n=1 Tax=Halosimplex salinum TaxID=1710538 RepID=UPI000F46C52C|nr:alkaline phosphatase family protein [Halosimplex salinum]
MTIAVLGLDALDYALAEKWGCDNILLENHQQLKTDSHSLEVPATIEVWPTIATGMPPSEHGVFLDATKRDDGVAITFARQLVEMMPSKLHKQIIAVRNFSSNGQNYPTTDREHVFESGVVKNWPGISPCEDWAIAGEWFSAFTTEELKPNEFRSRYLRQTGEQFGWLVGAAQAKEPIAGVHAHILDHMGHAYAERPETLRQYYTIVDNLVGMIRKVLPKIVIVSDHGMQTTVTEDEEPGVHSVRATISSSIDSELPASIYEIRSWLEERIDSGPATESSGVDAPMDHLKDLGYL